VPVTVSPVIQRSIEAPVHASVALPATSAAIKRRIAAINAGFVPLVAALLRRYPATIVSTSIAGVHVYVVTPATRDPALERRLLVNVHGGAYALFAGRSGLNEAIIVAHHTRTRVVAIDYRMPPDHPFPAALDDTIAVWRALVRQHDPRTMGLFGTSAGGGLTLAAVQRFRMLGLPLPGALFVGTPWSDLERDDDSQFTNVGLDDVLVDDTSLRSFALLYAHGRSLRDPALSPIHGDFHGFPPTILISGTRDLFLSMTVRTHRKLRAAGVNAELNVFEALSHDDFLLHDTSPESIDAFSEVAGFFDRHLER
jgi:acetyl esterase/lipase